MMPRFFVRIVLIVVFMIVLSRTHAETRAWGWRGDGTGKFPDAEAPVKWGRASVTMESLTAQAGKPKNAKGPAATPVVHGNISEWLVVGPFEYDADAKEKDLVEKAFIPNEATVKPDAGEQVVGVAWKKVRATGNLVRMRNYYADTKHKVFYAHTYLHTPRDVRVWARVASGAARFWLNGEELCRRSEKGNRPGRIELELKKGWNRLLVKMVSSRRTDNWARLYNFPRDTAFFQMLLCGRSDGETFKTDNILWQTPLPQAIRFSCAQPLIVGDRIFVNADPSFLICYDKNTGKQLWIDYTGHYEFVTAAERAAHADAFKKIDPAARRIKALASSWRGTVEEDMELHKLVADVRIWLKNVDRKKYARVANRQEAGSAGLCSATDGKHIYTWFADGVVVCHTLDGRRKWITLGNEGRSGVGGKGDYHGYQTSPILTDTEFVVPMTNLIAFDRETGKVKWKIRRDRWKWNAAKPDKPVTAEGTDCVNYAWVGLYKPGIGFFAWSRSTLEGKRAYRAGYDGTVMTVLDIPDEITGETRLKLRRIGNEKSVKPVEVTPNSWSAGKVQANVLVHEGLIYVVTMGGPLHVYDEKTLAPVYTTSRLELNTMMWAYPYPHGSGVCASPALGGKHIYLFGNNGTTLVVKPGRKFEVVAKNRIERLLPGHFGGGTARPSKQGYYTECTASSPIFDGKRIYYQGEGYLYCIGEE